MAKLELIPSYEEFGKQLELNEADVVKRADDTGRYRFVVISTAKDALATMRARIALDKITANGLASNFVPVMLHDPIFAKFKQAYDQPTAFFLAYDELKHNQQNIFTGRSISLYIISVIDKSRYNEFPKQSPEGIPYYIEDTTPEPFHVWLIPTKDLVKYAKNQAQANVLVQAHGQLINTETAKLTSQIQAQKGSVAQNTGNRIEFQANNLNFYYIPAVTK